VIVVYKIDRLTRSLADFAKLVEAFDAKKISFVAVTQQFNTTTSMGRLTLNVLLSFAQFERELSSERVRDKIAASRKKGKWTGGSVPLGYISKDKKLIINEADAKTVRLIFSRYLVLRSFRKLIDELNQQRVVTNTREIKNKMSGGVVNAFLKYVGHCSCMSRHKPKLFATNAREEAAGNDKQPVHVKCFVVIRVFGYAVIHSQLAMGQQHPQFLAA
jgi:hypothetical protein